MSGKHSIGLQVVTVEDFIARRAASADGTVQYENQILGSVVKTLKWVEMNEADLRAAMSAITAGRNNVTSAGEVSIPNDVDVFSEQQRAALLATGRSERTVMCPDHPRDFVRLKLEGTGQTLRMKCAVEGCRYRRPA